MLNQKTYLTKEGQEELKKELKQLLQEKRPYLVERVAQARGFGDLTENAEYANAREELSFVDGRIEELEQILAKAKIIKNKTGKTNSTVNLGCRVRLKVNKEEHEYVVVGEWEADPMQKRISHTSPLGKALLGKRVGDRIEIEAPVGKILYEIRKIS